MPAHKCRQDGSYLAELLLSQGYQVHGLVRRASTFNTRRIAPRYLWPTEVDYLLADASRAWEKMGWQPRVCFRELVRIMKA